MLSTVSVFEVLADPRRRQILDLLRDGERPVGYLVDRLAAAQPAVSKHLRVLRDAGLVASRVDAQRRLYRIELAPLREVDDWVAPYRRLWSSALDALEQHLDGMDDVEDVDDGPDDPRAGRRGR
jgi:DNA-binding transcriptional ArsR family regulator